MRNITILFSIFFLFAQTADAQCGDKTTRDKIIYSALRYFSDSINSSASISKVILVDTIQYTEYPGHLSFEPDLLALFADQKQLGRLISGFSQTMKIKESLKDFQFCSRMFLTTNKTIIDILNDSSGWKHFYKVYPQSQGYYYVTQPFIEGDYSIMYLENYCGNLCGSGYIFYLHFDQKIKTWVVIYTRQTWVS